MRIRKTKINDIDRVLEIYENGRQYMRQNGNLEQWNNNYPSKEVVDEDISNGWSYVVIDEDTNEIIGVFAYLPGPDITYRKIMKGNGQTTKTIMSYTESQSLFIAGVSHLLFMIFVLIKAKLSESTHTGTTFLCKTP